MLPLPFTLFAITLVAAVRAALEAHGLAHFADAAVARCGGAPLEDLASRDLCNAFWLWDRTGRIPKVIPTPTSHMHFASPASSSSSRVARAMASSFLCASLCCCPKQQLLLLVDSCHSVSAPRFLAIVRQSGRGDTGSSPVHPCSIIPGAPLSFYGHRYGTHESSGAMPQRCRRSASSH